MGERDTSSESRIDIPAIGTDAAPSEKMIVQGNVGNGSWDKLTPELARQVQAERKELGKQRKQIYRDGYDQAIEDLQSAGLRLKVNTVLTALDISERRRNGDELTKREFDEQKLGLDTMDKLDEFYFGKNTTHSEKDINHNILAIFQNKDINDQ